MKWYNIQAIFYFSNPTNHHRHAGLTCHSIPSPTLSFLPPSHDLLPASPSSPGTSTPSSASVLSSHFGFSVCGAHSSLSTSGASSFGPCPLHRGGLWPWRTYKSSRRSNCRGSGRLWARSRRKKEVKRITDVCLMSPAQVGLDLW
jgi:hypothetical protein